MPYAVVACATMFFWAISLRAYFSTVMPTIAADVSISAGTAGALIGVMSLGYCLAMWGIGFLRGTRKRRVLLGSAFSILCTGALALAPGVPALFAAAFAAGLGLGCYLPLGLAIIADVSKPGRRARNMSMHEVMASVGNVTGSAFVAVALPALTWRQATLAWMGVGTAVFVLFSLLREPPPKERAVSVGAPLRLDATLLACVAAFAVTQMLIGGLISVLPLVLVNIWGAGQGEAAVLVGVGRAAGLAGVGIAGAFGDRLGAANLARVFLLLALVSTTVMAIVPYGTAFAISVLGLNVAASGAIMLLTIVVAQVYPGREKERAFSVTSGVAGLSGLVAAPVFFGSLVEHGLAQAPFALAAAFALVATFLVGYLGRRSAPVPVRT